MTAFEYFKEMSNYELKRQEIRLARRHKPRDLRKVLYTAFYKVRAGISVRVRLRLTPSTIDFLQAPIVHCTRSHLLINHVHTVAYDPVLTLHNESIQILLKNTSLACYMILCRHFCMTPF